MGSPSSTEGPKLGCQVSPTQPNPLRPPILPDQLARFLHHSPPPQHPSNNPFLNLPAFPASSGPPPRLHHHHHLLQHGFSLPKNEAAAATTAISGGDADGDRRRGLFPSAPPPPPPHQQQQAQAPPHQGSISTASSPSEGLSQKVSAKVLGTQCTLHCSRTEIGKRVCAWLREICSCSWITVLPGPAWLLLNKICTPFSRCL